MESSLTNVKYMCATTKNCMVGVRVNFEGNFLSPYQFSIVMDKVTKGI